MPPAARAWVARCAGSAVVRARRMAGASSTAVHALVLADGARLVLRRYVWPGFLEAEPDAPVREAAALRFAAGAGLPVPDVVAADPTGGDAGDGVPALLMTRLAGRAVDVPDLDRLAEVAARVHAVDAGDLAHEWFPWSRGATTAPPPASARPALWERAIEVWSAGPPPAPPALLHRDLHPGNVLWRRGRSTGLVDWVNACRGPWGCDVATCRSNLVALGGPEAGDRFVAAYERVTGRRHDPWWDLSSILERGPAARTPDRLAVDEPRLAAALGALTGVPPRR